MKGFTPRGCSRNRSGQSTLEPFRTTAFNKVAAMRSIDADVRDMEGDEETTESIEDKVARLTVALAPSFYRWCRKCTQL